MTDEVMSDGSWGMTVWVAEKGGDEQPAEDHGSQQKMIAALTSPPASTNSTSRHSP